jgi:hypothetical protein
MLPEGNGFSWARTNDLRVKSPLLYHLSYKPGVEMARLELATFRLSVECSNQLSYISKQGESLRQR